MYEFKLKTQYIKKLLLGKLVGTFPQAICGRLMFGVIFIEISQLHNLITNYGINIPKKLILYALKSKIEAMREIPIFDCDTNFLTRQVNIAIDKNTRWARTKPIKIKLSQNEIPKHIEIIDLDTADYYIEYTTDKFDGGYKIKAPNIPAGRYSILWISIYKDPSYLLNRIKSKERIYHHSYYNFVGEIFIENPLPFRIKNYRVHLKANSIHKSLIGPGFNPVGSRVKRIPEKHIEQYMKKILAPALNEEVILSFLKMLREEPMIEKDFQIMVEPNLDRLKHGYKKPTKTGDYDLEAKITLVESGQTIAKIIGPDFSSLWSSIDKFAVEDIQTQFAKIIRQKEKTKRKTTKKTRRKQK